MPGVDFVFHAAALKQVPSCESCSMRASMTNAIGTKNVLTDAALRPELVARVSLQAREFAREHTARELASSFERLV